MYFKDKLPMRNNDEGVVPLEFTPTQETWQEITAFFMKMPGTFERTAGAEGLLEGQVYKQQDRKTMR